MCEKSKYLTTKAPASERGKEIIIKKKRYWKGQLIVCKGDLDELTYVPLHSPIRDVYLCIQGFDSRLACRICNNTVHSRIRADGLGVPMRQDGEKQRERESVTKKEEDSQKKRTTAIEKTEMWSTEWIQCNQEVPIEVHRGVDYFSGTFQL